MHLINKPEVMIAAALTKFDAQGKLTDEPTRGVIRDLVVNLAAWTRRIALH
jgi:chromate reductase